MSDETPLIFGDAAAAELSRYPGRKWLRRKKKRRPPLTNCENCGTALTGRYCAQCGQPAVDYHRSFGSILADAADAFFNLDERFLKTFWLLLIKPWPLTDEFVEGKRVRYAHPLHVYRIASVLFAKWVKRKVKEEMGPTGDRGGVFLKALIQNIARMVLCCIPLFALVLKILYVFKKRFYIEHLVFALHTHAFVFLSTLVIIG